jgi:glycosyltransferase involved in cell wall biosynthesis
VPRHPLKGRIGPEMAATRKLRLRPTPSTGAKIAHVGPHPSRIGGMAAVLRDLLSSPLATKYRLYVIPTYRTKSAARRILVFSEALLSLARWCGGDGPRLVHIHSAVHGSIYRKALCIAVAKLAGRRVVLQLHTGVGDIDAFAARLDPVRRSLISGAIRRADVVLSVSSAGASRIEEAFGVEGVTVIPNAAPALNGSRLEAGSADANGNGRRPRVLYMGGFSNEAKGGRVLLRALPDILERCPELGVTLAGPGDPPRELAALQRRHPEVRWVGYLDQAGKLEHFAKCEVFIMPSLSEGLPVALLEAMGHARAIVASDVGGIPDAVNDDVEAILVPPADPAALSAAVLRAVEDSRLRVRLGRAAQVRVNDFSRDQVFDRLAAIYDDLLARDGGR